ncbi:hypothetical protein QR680_014817 [Steinernema hermaphroditum]|uniref:F-box domain-containing protein n=1 Tax=Steinernema hermaphroditum TaxID=289476 RepID=A0AA39M4P4_9BILA|nr:hypothetical protein QR680_014817 [Steinernema hermaphroditum]
MQNTVLKLFPNERGAFCSKQHLPFNFDALSNGLLLKALSYLDSRSLADCRLVNHRWDSIITDHSLLRFKRLCLRIDKTIDIWNAQIKSKDKGWKDKTISTRNPTFLYQSLSFPNLFNINEVYFAACDLSVLINLLQKAPTERMTFIDLKHTGKDLIERDMSELWRILMLKPNLKTLNMNFIADFPISVLKSHGRGNLQKIESLSICGVQTTLDDLIFLKNEVSIRLSMNTVTSKSDAEVVELIESMLASPSDCYLGWIKGCNFMPVFLIVFWNWFKGTRFYGWCEENITLLPKENLCRDRQDIYGDKIDALKDEGSLEALLTENLEESGDFKITLVNDVKYYSFTPKGIARRYEQLADYNLFKDFDNILIIVAEFLFELAQNTQVGLAPNMLIAPFSAIRATLIFLIIRSTDPPLTKAFWFIFILFSSCFVHNIIAKVFMCTVTCRDNVEVKKYDFLGHFFCSDTWSPSPRCP